MFTRKYFIASVFAALLFAQSNIGAAQAANLPPTPAVTLTPVTVTLTPTADTPSKATPQGPAAGVPVDTAHPATSAPSKPTAIVKNDGKSDSEGTWIVLGIIAFLLIVYYYLRRPDQSNNRGRPIYYDPYDQTRARGRILSDRERRELSDARDEYQPNYGEDDWIAQRRQMRDEPTIGPQPAASSEDSMQPRYQRQSQATLILPTGKDKKTFADVAGQPEAIARLQEIVLWLKQPEIYNRHNAKLPRGILLVGPPGTGKTLCAQAVAGETHGSMFTTAASSFVEMYVGVGASRVRALFADAKAQRKQTGKPVIIFVDELDAVGGARNQGANTNSEREQTLNQLLVEMDGFTKNEGIIVIAATNRPDMLDPALRRKGRFDMEVQVDLPDVNGREAILQVHTRGKLIAPSVDFKLLAKRTFGMSGADLEAAANEAAIIAAREQGKLEAAERESAEKQSQESVIGNTMPVSAEMFDEAISIVESGDARRERFKAMSPDDKKQTAYHELGHAVVIHKTGGDPITKITILPRGRALGYVQTHSEGDRWNLTESQMRKKITAAMAGRIAQEIFLQTVDTGAASDFEQANRMARKMVTQFGMSKLGAIYLPDSGLAIGPALTDRIDAEVNAIVADCGKEARSIIETHRQEIEALVSLLLARETLFGADFVTVFEEAETKRLAAQAAANAPAQDNK